MSVAKTDLLIIGSGLASLALALKVAEFANVIILSKEACSDTNTAMAQGGIAAVMSSEDSFESHIHDTLVAGAGLCKLDVVQNIIEQAPARIKDLQAWGTRFDTTRYLSEFNSIENSSSNEEAKNHKDDDKTQPEAIEKIDLTREGGHSYRRILHFEDQTGSEIQRSLLEKVRANSKIKILERHFAIDLILNKQIEPYSMLPNACVGAYVLDKKTSTVTGFLAKQVVLATGGAGKVYLYTSNWAGATGDGIAMAFRAGCRVANLEFMQFHPTCLYHPEARNFLISEALRGEGGILINSKGEAFMNKHHPLASLAPRDIVARSIDAEIKKSGAHCVYLDMTKKSEEFLKARFPAIFAKCLEHGINMATDPIPVVPAAHYLCGGVLTNVDGQTDLPGLWALGETACTGLHGANRLASNSLLECLAMAENCSQELRKNWSQYQLTNGVPPEWRAPVDGYNADEMVVINHVWEEIRRLMWNYVGIVRSNKRLQRARSRLENILDEVKEYYSNMKIHSDIIELRNIATVAQLTVACALNRKESRGIHSSLDYPQSSLAPQSPAKDSILFRGQLDNF